MSTAQQRKENLLRNLYHYRRQKKLQERFEESKKLLLDFEQKTEGKLPLIKWLSPMNLWTFVAYYCIFNMIVVSIVLSCG